MSKIQLYIASSLDGFIAREDGSLDWLVNIENPDQVDHGYNQFIRDIDLVIMGRKTYEEVLGFDVEWPYSDCQTYVVTAKPEYEVRTPATKLLSFINKSSIQKLKSESRKNIWLVGGGKLISGFLNESAIDEMILSMVPVILGKGIRLFPDETLETKFELLNSESFETGIVNLTYRKKTI